MPQSFNPRDMEKFMDGIKKSIEEKDFKTPEELQAYLDSFTGKPLPDFDDEPKDAKSQAQDIIFDAWEEPTQKTRVKMAHEALAIYPDCADAYNILAEDQAKNTPQAKSFYEKGVEAGRRALGEKLFEENDGHFWGYTQTRPYMRSKAGLMECCWVLAKDDEAIAHAREMLVLNTNDNQGIRYLLSSYLAEGGRFDELDELLNKSAFKNDGAADWLYTSVLLNFVKYGPSQARRTLDDALSNNPYVPEYLTREKKIPAVLPASIIMGGEDEAYCYAERNIRAWMKIPGLIQWLKQQVIHIDRTISKVGRNEQCPCGSGKKFKKCCGANVN